MYSEQDWQYIQEFSEDAKDYLQNIEIELLDLKDNNDQELLNNLLRSVCSLTTSAEMLGLKSFYSLSYRWQKCLELIRDKQITINHKIETLGLKLVDKLFSLIELLEYPNLSQEQQDINKSKQICSEIEGYLKAYLSCRKSSFVSFSELDNFIDLNFALSNDLKVPDNQSKLAKINKENTHTLIREFILQHFAKKLLPHLIHNAISHGIETSEMRLKIGKLPQGVITIYPEIVQEQTIINFQDDGAGINPELIKEKAITKNLITPKEAQNLSLTDTYNLLFIAGFSTKQQENLIAGRGVGMDIIKTELTKVGADTIIDSTIGKGTTFKLIYPYS
jgi:chemotaxis protein histidine kinase CheA